MPSSGVKHTWTFSYCYSHLLSLCVLIVLTILLYPEDVLGKKPASQPNTIPVSNPQNSTNEIVSNLNSTSASFNLSSEFFPIGALVPMTANGTASIVGIQYVEAMKCAINMVNNDSSILPSTKLEYNIQNTATDGNVAVNQALILNRRNVMALIGPRDDFDVTNVINLFVSANVPVVTFGSGSTTTSNNSTYPNFQRMWPSDAVQATAIAQTMKLFQWSYVAAIFSSDSFGRSASPAFSSAAAELGIRMACATSDDSDADYGAEKFADCLRTSDANVVLLYMSPAEAQSMISVIHSYPENDRLTFIASSQWAAMFNQTFFTNQPFPMSSLEGSLAFIPKLGDLDEYQKCVANVSPSNTNYEYFAEAWQAGFSCTLPGTSSKGQSSLPSCPADLSQRTSPCECTGNENLMQLPTPPSLNYVRDSVVLYATALGRIQNNCQSLSRRDYCSMTVLTSDAFIDAVQQVEFEGLTGTVSFNMTAPERQETILEIFQFNDQGNMHQIGVWNASGVYASSETLMFKNGTSTYPLSYVVPATTTFSSSAGVKVITCLSIAGIVVCLGIMAFFIYFRKSHVIRIANLYYLLLGLLSLCMIFTSLILWGIPQSKAVCTSKTALGMMGFGLLTGVLIVKAQRYFRLFVFWGPTTNKLSNRELFTVVGANQVVEFAIFLLYIFVGGFPTATVTQSTTEAAYDYITCDTNPRGAGKAIVAVYLVYNAYLLFYSTILLIMSRDLFTIYQDLRCVYFAVLDWVVVFSIIVPIYYTTTDTDGVEVHLYMIRSLGVIFVATVTILALYVPKIVYVLRTNKSGQVESEIPISVSLLRSILRSDTNTTGNRDANDTTQQNVTYFQTTPYSHSMNETDISFDEEDEEEEAAR